MEKKFYGNEKNSSENTQVDLQALIELAKTNPDLLTQIIQSVQPANT